MLNEHELMEELYKVAPSMIEEHGKALIIKHVWEDDVERPKGGYTQHHRIRHERGEHTTR